jgi:hypothetical protein
VRARARKISGGRLCNGFVEAQDVQTHDLGVHIGGVTTGIGEEDQGVGVGADFSKHFRGNLIVLDAIKWYGIYL